MQGKKQSFLSFEMSNWRQHSCPYFCFCCYCFSYKKSAVFEQLLTWLLQLCATWPLRPCFSCQNPGSPVPGVECCGLIRLNLSWGLRLKNSSLLHCVASPCRNEVDNPGPELLPAPYICQVFCCHCHSYANPKILSLYCSPNSEKLGFQI